MSNKKTKESNEFIDIVGLTSYYIRYWKWFVLSIIVCAAIAFIYLKSTPSVYLNTANILIKTEDSRTSAMSSTAVKSLGFGGLSASENIEDEVNIITSHTLVKEMVYDLDLYKSYSLKKFPFDKSLYKNSPITIDVPKTFIDTLNKVVNLMIEQDKNATKVKIKYGKEKLGEFTIDKLPNVIDTKIGKFAFSKNSNSIVTKDSYKLEVNISGLDGAAEFYASIVNVAPISKKSNIISLSIEDFETRRGTEILNKLILLYNNDALDDKNKMAKNTASFIRERVDTISGELASIEVGIESYKRANNLIDITLETGASLGKVANLKEKALEFEIQLSLLDMTEKYMSDPNNTYSLIPSSTGMPGGVEGAVQNYNAVILERAQLLKNASENNHIILSLNNQLDLLRENVKASIKNIRKEINLIKQDWAKTENLLQSKLGEVPRQEREFLEIRRQQQIKSEIYIFLLQKLQEAELTLASNTPKAKVVDEAYTRTKPVSPKRLLTLLIGCIIGGIIPLVIIWVKDMFKPNLSDLDELERHTNAPILGEVCLDKSGEKIVVSETANTPTAELFRLIRTNLQFVLTKKDKKVILITSSISGEGKSFFTINFATSLSLIKGKKVVLVGLDIRKPKLTEYLSVKTNKGITTYLSTEGYKPEDIIVNLSDIRPNLDFIPSGPVPPNPSELLLNDRLDELFDYLRENYDYIIVDTAPIGMVSDTFALSRISDATLYLYRADYTNRSYLKMLDNVIDENRLKKVYLVMNGTRTKSGYGYGYGGKQK